MAIFVCQFDYKNFLTFLSDCEKDTDCPNNGTNYKCVNKFCDCMSGFVLDGKDCVGTLTHLYLQITSDFVALQDFTRKL